MARISALSNPTGLVELDKKNIGLIFNENPTGATYSLSRLDLDRLSLPATLEVVVVARRGNAEQRTSHGALSEWNRGLVDISELGRDGHIRFRVLLEAPGSPRLVAVAENIRPEGVGDSDSLFGLEPADLGQIPWELMVLEAEGRAVIRFNRNIYSNAAVAEADVFFTCLVFPEAVRQLGYWHTQNPGALADEQWFPLVAWLASHGVTDSPEEDWDQDEKMLWCKAVAGAFSERFGFSDQLQKTYDHGVKNEN
jgi:hypothetical protein